MARSAARCRTSAGFHLRHNLHPPSFTLRRNDHGHVAAFQFRLLFYNGCVAKLLSHSDQQRFTQFRMTHLTATEHDRDARLVALLEEAPEDSGEAAAQAVFLDAEYTTLKRVPLLRENKELAFPQAAELLVIEETYCDAEGETYITRSIYQRGDSDTEYHYLKWEGENGIVLPTTVSISGLLR